MNDKTFPKRSSCLFNYYFFFNTWSVTFVKLYCWIYIFSMLIRIISVPQFNKLVFKYFKLFTFHKEMFLFQLLTPLSQQSVRGCSLKYLLQTNLINSTCQFPTNNVHTVTAVSVLLFISWPDARGSTEKIKGKTISITILLSNCRGNESFRYRYDLWTIHSIALKMSPRFI